MHAAGKHECLINTVPNVDLRTHPRLFESEVVGPSPVLMHGPAVARSRLVRPVAGAAWDCVGLGFVRGSLGLRHPHRLDPPVFALAFVVHLTPEGDVGSAQAQGLTFCGPHRVLLTYLARRV